MAGGRGAGRRGFEAAGPCSSVVEHSLGKGEVARSIRAVGTRIRLVANSVNGNRLIFLRISESGVETGQAVVVVSEMD